MPVLITPRLHCSPLQEQDWPFFLALQQHPDVMRFVAEDRPVADIRAAFEARLSPWTPGSAHWLCLVVRDALTRVRWASPAIFIGRRIAQKSVFFSHPRRREKVTASNPCRRSALLPLKRAAYADSPPPLPRECRLKTSAGKSPVFAWKASYVRAITLRALAE